MNLKIATRRVSLLLLLFTLCAVTALAQTTSFTYQGRLTDGGTAANGNYDLQFTLWDALSGGTQQPQPSPVTVARSAVAVANGIFTVQLDFGATAFPGANRFLEISARLMGAGSFTTLAPRQPITSTPYAIRSLNASSADTIPANALPAGNGNYIQANPPAQQNGANFNISGNGTAGGTLSANIVNATTQYNIGGNRVLLSNAGGDNLFVGLGAGVNTTGNSNSFFGGSAGASNATGTDNSIFGYLAGFHNTAGRFNTFVGQGSGMNNTGDNNAFLGHFSGGSNGTGSGNTAVGNLADVGANNLTNATAIGANARVDQSNTLVLGSVAGVNLANANVNVGIGTTTPQARLDIAATGDGAGLLRFSTERPWVFRQAYSGAGTALRLQPITGLKNFEITAAGGTNVATFVGDDANPRVGIGTTSPAHRLSVSGGPPWTTFQWTGAVALDNVSAIGWQQNAGLISFGIGQSTGGLYFFRTGSPPGTAQFGAGYDFFISDSGLVGIGTTAPDNKLTVNGAADKPGGGSWGTFSDERLKNIKGRFTPGLKAVMQLKPLRYEYKPDNALGLKLEGEQVGFSAQAVQRVIPEAVTRNDKGYLLVNNDPIMWTMLNAVKEQQQQIERQQKQIATLMTSNAALNARWRGVEKSLRKNAGSTRRRR